MTATSEERYAVFHQVLVKNKQVAFGNMNMHQKALGPRLIQFLHKDSLCDDFLVSTLDFVNLQIKMEQLRRGKQVTMDLLRDGKLITTNEIVGAELELMIEESTRLLSEKYTLVVMEHSDYTAHLMDQNFFEHLFKFTNKLLESQFGRQVRDDNFAKREMYSAPAISIRRFIMAHGRF